MNHIPFQTVWERDPTTGNAGLMLVAASIIFWLSWLLMPGVGVTDAQQILTLVASQRSLVAGSVVLQLISAVLYVPALLQIAANARYRNVSAVPQWSGLLLIGAMGSAADAVLHLLAYAMTEPGLEVGTLVRVMEFMQGPGLLLLAPLIACFFLGGGGLSLAFVNIRTVSLWNLRLYAIALVIAVMGGGMVSSGLLSTRIVGLTTLGLVSLAQAWIGIALWKDSGKLALMSYSLNRLRPA